MTGNINLTASMRTNLLSLQQISKLQDRTQLRLSTGLKVNSAIDNPSSYYTAQSLNNRADDLSALLDSMGQGIQTIKAASEGIETAEDLVTQMKAIAEQVSTSGTYVPDKEYFIDKVGENGAVVSTAEELRQAIADNKETICVYGKIDLGDISTTGGISLQENQKLVGVEYFGNFKDGEGFSSISATDSVAGHALIDIKKTGCLVSDLNLNYENSVVALSTFVIKSSGSGVVTDFQNLDIVFNCHNNNPENKAAIATYNEAISNISGNINIVTSGAFSYGIHTSQKATTYILSDTVANITTSGQNGYGIYSSNESLIDVRGKINIKTSSFTASGINVENSTVNLNSNLNLNMNISGAQSSGMRIVSNSVLNINQQTSININLFESSTAGISIDLSTLNTNKNSNIKITAYKEQYGIFAYNSNMNFSGNMQITTVSQMGIVCNNRSNNHVYVSSTALMYFNTPNGAFYSGRSDGVSANVIEIASGAKLAFEKNGSTKWYEVREDYKNENTLTTLDKTISATNVESTLNVASTSSWKTPADIIAEQEAKEQTEKDEAEKKSYETYQKQFNNALSQYDMLINDSAYKGINLLKEDTLKVNFNEDKSAHLLIQGVDMTSEGIGLLSADWNTDKDVQTSLEQVLSAQKKLRSAATKLGNCYSIVSERQNFTENLINVLTEGADKLTLADMNEESANMLALQTQQQLAINSLSLASQASQGVLRLF